MAEKKKTTTTNQDDDVSKETVYDLVLHTQAANLDLCFLAVDTNRTT